MSPGTPTLTDGQLDALENLRAKEAGEAVAWINIQDAMALSRLGLAARTREGWSITPDGAGLLKGLD